MRWLVLLLAMAGSAWAETRSPFVLVDQLDGVSRGGADVATVQTTRDGIRFLLSSVHGHAVEPTTGVGVFTRLGYLSLEDQTDAPERRSPYRAFTNPTVGLLWAPPSSGPWAFISHLGVGIETSGVAFSEDAIAAALLRPQEFYSALPQHTSAELGTSVLVRDTHVIARVDLGLHAVMGCDADPRVCDAFATGIHVNAAVGWVPQPPWILALEVSTIWLQIDEDLYMGTKGPGGIGFDRTDVDGLAAFALTGRYEFSHVQIYGAATTPLRKHPKDILRSAFTIGVEGSL